MCHFIDFKFKYELLKLCLPKDIYNSQVRIYFFPWCGKWTWHCVMGSCWQQSAGWSKWWTHWICNSKDCSCKRKWGWPHSCTIVCLLSNYLKHTMKSYLSIIAKTCAEKRIYYEEVICPSLLKLVLKREHMFCFYYSVRMHLSCGKWCYLMLLWFIYWL